MSRSFFRTGITILVSLLFLARLNAFHDTTSLNTNKPTTTTPLPTRFFPDLSLPGVVRDQLIPIEENIPDSVYEKRAYAHALLQKVLAGQRFLESLDALAEINLPVGVVKAGGAIDYTILIDRIEFTREGATMDIYVSLALPQTSTRLAFHGKVPLSARGGISGQARVFLLGDHSMKFGPHGILTVKGRDQTYVEFDCNGFTGVNLHGELQFSSDVIQPEEENGIASPDRLSITINTYTQSLNDILVNVTIPPFQVRGLRGFGFRAKEAYLDWSDLVNPPGLTFPANYTSPFLSAALAELWHGIYIRELEVRFPPAFIRRNTPDRVVVGARHMILDDTGITGELYAKHLFADGDMNGWTYSLDQVSLHLTSGHVAGFSLAGELAIPVIRGKDGSEARFRYAAERNADGNYVFAVEVKDELKLDLWLADIKLLQGSKVLVRQEDDRFHPSAHLNGELTIHLVSKGPKASINSLRFEDMVIDSDPPYFRPGTFGFGREGHSSNVSGYPVVFDNIGVESEDRRAGIAFDVRVNLGNREDESFAGKASLTVWGIQNDRPKYNDAGEVIGIDRYHWEFDEVELSSLKIDIRKPKVIELTGEVRFFDDDNVYGEGFKGRLKGKIQSIAVEAEALFGRTETFRYWYADALVELKAGIPVVPGVLSVFGFGGGYYSRMRQSDKPVDGTLGRSPSGITYVPDDNTIGIRAAVLIGTARPEAMRGEVALEVVLNRHGGINSTTFTGNARFMSTESLTARQIRELAAAAVAGQLTEKLGSLATGQVSGNLRLHFDNVNDIFHGNIEVYVNVAGGIVRGVSANNKAGWAVIHFEKRNWYIHIGSPDQMLGLEVARIFRAGSYFMLGTNLPGSPPPPAQVSEILGDVDLDYMRDMNALESGTGIAFGLHFTVDTGDLRFLMFYGRFSAGTGLDFMLKDYGNTYHCAGSTGPLGIDGWYANGQAYAFVMGKIGIRVNLRFYKGRYEILRIGAAAVLQAKGPNPFWMKGRVGGYYRILGGLIKGRCNFEITIGKDCKPVAEENLLEDIAMIAAITPAEGAVDVGVFNAPQVVFNIPVGEVFTVDDMEGNIHSFRAVLDNFSVTNKAQEIDGTLVWNDDMTVVAYNVSDLLPGESSISVTTTLVFEEKINGLWTHVRFNNAVVTESMETTFNTGKAPAFIPASNVAHAYPAPDQSNYYRSEHTHGFIQLRNGQPYLFEPGNGVTQRMRITDTATGQVFETTLSYDRGMKRISFDMPQALSNSREYQMQIISMPNEVSRIDANITTASRELITGDANATAMITTRSADGTIDLPEQEPIYTSVFRTSRYDTFVEKMKRVQLSPAIRISAGISIFQLVSYFRGDERLDDEEIGSDGFVRMEAVPDGNRWYEGYVYPLLYKDYPLLGWMTVRRPDPHRLGIPPVRDIYTENARPSGIDPSPFTDEFLVYNLGQSVAGDFYDLQRHAVNYVADYGPHVPDRIGVLVMAHLPYIRYGKYRIRFSYVIPGIEKITSAYETEIFNRVPDSD